MVPSSSMSLTRSVISVILGGGRGTRLLPLTKYRAKPAVPLAGKYRLIDIPISNLLNSGLDRIYVLTQFQSSSLNQHITRTYHLDPFSRGFVALEVAHQSEESSDWYQGTADAVRRNLKTLVQWQSPCILILPGDTIFRMDLRRMLEFHLERDADITMALHPTPAERASSFGLVQLDERDRIIRMREKPPPEKLAACALSPRDMARWGLDDANPFMASMGIYIFRTKVLAEILEDPEMLDFGHQILPAAVEERAVYGYVHPDYWEDIGTIRAFFDFNLALVRRDPPFSFFHPEAPIYTRMRFLPASNVQHSTLNDTILTDGCQIDHAQIEQCVIGVRSLIGRGVRMRRTVMMGDDYYEFGNLLGGYEPIPPDAPLMGVADECEIENAIIDKNARVGRGCRIVNAEGKRHYDDPKERYYIRDGIVIVPKHAILEPGTII